MSEGQCREAKGGSKCPDSHLSPTHHFPFNLSRTLFRDIIYRMNSVLRIQSSPQLRVGRNYKEGNGESRMLLVLIPMLCFSLPSFKGSSYLGHIPLFSTFLRSLLENHPPASEASFLCRQWRHPLCVCEHMMRLVMKNWAASSRSPTQPVRSRAYCSASPEHLL